MGKSSKFQHAQVHEHWQLPVPDKVVEQLEIKDDDTLEWIIVDQNTVVLHRTDKSFACVKKKLPSTSRLFW